MFPYGINLSNETSPHSCKYERYCRFSDEIIISDQIIECLKKRKSFYFRRDDTFMMLNCGYFSMGNKFYMITSSFMIDYFRPDGKRHLTRKEMNKLIEFLISNKRVLSNLDSILHVIGDHTSCIGLCASCYDPVNERFPEFKALIKPLFSEIEYEMLLHSLNDRFSFTDVIYSQEIARQLYPVQNSEEIDEYSDHHNCGEYIPCSEEISCIFPQHMDFFSCLRERDFEDCPDNEDFISISMVVNIFHVIEVMKEIFEYDDDMMNNTLVVDDNFGICQDIVKFLELYSENTPSDEYGCDGGRYSNQLEFVPIQEVKIFLESRNWRRITDEGSWRLSRDAIYFEKREKKDDTYRFHNTKAIIESKQTLVLEPVSYSLVENVVVQEKQFICKKCGENIRDNTKRVNTSCYQKCNLNYHYGCFSQNDKCFSCESKLKYIRTFNKSSLKDYTETRFASNSTSNPEKILSPIQDVILVQEVIIPPVISEKKESTIQGWKNETLKTYEKKADPMKEAAKRERLNRKREKEELKRNKYLTHDDPRCDIRGFPPMILPSAILSNQLVVQDEKSIKEKSGKVDPNQKITFASELKASSPEFVPGRFTFI